MDPIDHALEILKQHAADEVHWSLEVPLLEEPENRVWRPRLRSNFKLFGLALIPTAQALEKRDQHVHNLLRHGDIDQHIVKLRLLHIISGKTVIPVNTVITVPLGVFLKAANPATPLQYLYPKCIRIANKLLPAMGIPAAPDFQVDWDALIKRYQVANLQAARLFEPSSFYEAVLALHFLLSTRGNTQRRMAIRTPKTTWLHRQLLGTLEALSDNNYPVAALRLAYLCSDLMAGMYIKTTTRTTSRLYYLTRKGYTVQAAHRQKPPEDRIDTYVDVRSSLFLENGGTMPRPWASIAMEPSSHMLLFVRIELAYNGITDSVDPRMMILLLQTDLEMALLVNATQIEPEVAAIEYTIATTSAGINSDGDTWEIAGELLSLGTDIHRVFEEDYQLKTFSIYHTAIRGAFTAYLDVMPKLPMRTAEILERVQQLLKEGIEVRIPSQDGMVLRRLYGAQLWLASSVGFVLGEPSISKRLFIRMDNAWWRRMCNWLNCPVSILVWRWFKTLLKNGPDSAYGRALHILTSKALEPYMALSSNLSIRDVQPAPPVENLAQVKYSHPVRGSTVLKRDSKVPEHRYGKPCVITMDDYNRFILNPDAEQLTLAAELLRYIQPPP